MESVNIPLLPSKSCGLIDTCQTMAENTQCMPVSPHMYAWICLHTGRALQPSSLSCFKRCPSCVSVFHRLGVWRQPRQHLRAHSTFASHTPPTPSESESVAFPVSWDLPMLQSRALSFRTMQSRNGVRVRVTCKGGTKQEWSYFHLLLSRSSCSKRKMRIHSDISVNGCLSVHQTAQLTVSCGQFLSQA